MSDAFGHVGGETQPTTGLIPAHHLVQTRFMDGNFAALQHRYFIRIDIDAEHIIADFGKTGTGNQSHIAGTEKGNFHAPTF